LPERSRSAVPGGPGWWGVNGNYRPAFPWEKGRIQALKMISHGCDV
jgi:hypothetical protein